jgi:hypothetical protein
LLFFSPEIAKRITVDLRNRIMVAESGFNNQLTEDTERYSENFLHTYSGFIDFENILLEANRYKLLKGYSNLLIFKETLKQIIREEMLHFTVIKGSSIRRCHLVEFKELQ